MKFIARQKIWLTIVVVTNLALWIIPSDIVEQVARDRQTMLGRYSRQQFNWIIAVALISIVTLYIDSATGAKYKRRWFQVTAFLLMLLPTMIVADFFLRSSDRGHYIHDTLAYHHPANGEYDRIFEDKPEAYRTYESAPKGYGKVNCELRADKRGFRNLSDLEQYDIVVLGDSFAEGSGVSDEHTWPVRLAELTGKSVYNLGMSGYAPLNYLESFREVGVALRPKVVLCMLYEGNDFRSAKADRKSRTPSLSARFKRYVKQSPVFEKLDQTVIDLFGPINSTGPIAGGEMLDWLPLAIPAGANAKHYAFAPKQIRDLYMSQKDFARDRHWLAPRKLLAELKGLCDDVGAKLFLVYAPTKAHVTLSAVSDLPAKSVRDFAAMGIKGELPDADTFLTQLLERLDAKESVVREWCERESIAFVGLTAPLRMAAMNGTQVYYTYDQHWPPTGHNVVAADLAQVLSAEPLLAAPDATQ